MNLDLGLLLASAVTLGAPLLLAAMGGLVSERAGVMNIALEGAMLAACCAGAIVGQGTSNPWIGLAAAIGCSVGLMLLHALFTQSFGIDAIVSGMAINLLAAGGTSFLRKAFPQMAAGRAALFPVQSYWVTALVAAAMLAFYLGKTRGGLWLRAAGHDAEKTRRMGVDPIRVRFRALAVTGVLCGLAGLLIVSNAGSFTDNMTAGRGYIALAALILGKWRPLPVLAACAAFGCVEALQLQLQGTRLAGANVPAELWSALPYVLTLLALVALSRRTSGAREGSTA